VSCTRDEQIRRVKARSGYSDELIEKIIATQIDATEREARSDYVVSNNGTIQELHDSVNAIFKNVQLRIKI
jgi:dephospho-CoA kinase